MRLDRSRRAEDDIWLGQKMLFFVLGAVIGIFGMATGRDWLVYVAIAVLAAGLILRMLGRRRARGIEREAPEPADWARFQDAPDGTTDAGDPPAEEDPPRQGPRE